MRKLLLIILCACGLTAIHAQVTDLSTMPKAKREAYLISKAKEVTKTMGPGWYRGKMLPVVTDTALVFPMTDDERQAVQQLAGRRYYSVRLYYDAATRRKVGWTFASVVDIWADDGEPASIIFGHNYGFNFHFISYKDWLKKGIKKKEKMRFEKLEPDTFY